MGRTRVGVGPCSVVGVVARHAVGVSNRVVTLAALWQVAQVAVACLPVNVNPVVP